MIRWYTEYNFQDLHVFIANASLSGLHRVSRDNVSLTLGEAENIKPIVRENEIFIGAHTPRRTGSIENFDRNCIRRIYTRDVRRRCALARSRARPAAVNVVARRRRALVSPDERP